MTSPEQIPLLIEKAELAVLKRIASVIHRHVASHHFARYVAVVAGGAFLGQLVTILASPLLTRLYSPADFGVLSAYSAGLSLLLVLVSWRYEMAIPLPKNEIEAANLMVLALGLVGFTSLGVAVLVWWKGEAFVDAFDVDELGPFLWLLPLGLLGAGVYQVLNYWAIRKSWYGQVARTKISRGLGQVVTQVGLGLLGWGPGGLVVGKVVGESVGSSALVGLVLRDGVGLFQNVSWFRIRSMAIRYRRFPLLSVVAGLLNTASLQVPALMLTALYGTQISGWYSLAHTVIGLPVTLIGNAISQVYMGESARLVNSNPKAAEQLFIRIAKRLTLFSVALALVLMPIAPWLFGIVFGPNWVQSGAYFRLLVPAFLGQMVVSPLSQSLTILERQDLSLLYNVIRIILTITSIYVPYSLGLGSFGVIFCFSIVRCATYVLDFCLAKYAFRRAAAQAYLG